MIFTPINSSTGKRIKIEIEEMRIPRGSGWDDTPEIFITEIASGSKFRVTGLACDLPSCKCDAKIHDYTKRKQRKINPFKE